MPIFLGIETGQYLFPGLSNFLDEEIFSGNEIVLKLTGRVKPNLRLEDFYR